jgi:crotonobetainyl-CoA:carnitine CoA-transferase CaiB-like acyl-CoA transferase
MTAPLVDVRVVDLTRWLAGPFATSMLGDMGADVIKVEKPDKGDGTRTLDSVFVDGLSSYHLGLNRNKRSVAVDIARPEGREVVAELAKTADVLIENFRPGVMAELGLDYDDLRSVNPRLIYCAISSFGSTGPLRDKAGMDLILQAMGGVMGLTGEAGGPPYRVGVPIADYVGAYQAVTGIAMALLARQHTGAGQRVDVALLDGQLSLLANYIPGFLETGIPSGPVGHGHPQLVPYQLFPTSDGHLIIACLTERFWQGMCRSLELDALIEDPRFVTNEDRVRHRDALVPLIADATATYESQDLAAILDAADVPSAPVLSLAELLTHPQVLENEMLIELEQRRAGRYKVVGIPIKLRGTPGAIRIAAVELGEHTREILGELRFDESHVRTLFEAGVCAEPRDMSTNSRN